MQHRAGFKPSKNVSIDLPGITWKRRIKLYVACLRIHPFEMKSPLSSAQGANNSFAELDNNSYGKYVNVFERFESCI